MDTNITALKAALQTKVDEVTDTLLNARAQVKLDQYIAAESAYSNLTASAADSYSDVRGSVSKRDIDIARDQKEALYNELAELLLQADVELPAVSGVAYWSLGE